MAVKFNPFTGQLQIDEKGSGGGSSYIDGEVATYNDLSLDAGVAALNTAWLVREASGSWLTGRKPAGIYIRTATGGSSRDADYTYAGIFPDVFSDANFTLYDDADTTKNLKFQLSGIATGTTRTITVPNANVTLPNQGTSTTDNVAFNAVDAITFNASSGENSVIFDATGITFGGISGSNTRTDLGLGTAATRDINALSDSDFRVVDNSDSSKKVALECSGISASTTRTLTIANRSGTVVVSDTSAGSGSDVVNNIVSLTQAEYNAIGSPDAATLYLITDP